MKKNGIGQIIIAVLLLALGLGFGGLRIYQGISLYQNRPTEREIRRMEEYLELMEDLERHLKDGSYADMDLMAQLEEDMEDSALRSSQKNDLRDLYSSVIAQASGGSVDREMAENEITREIIYYRQTIPNPNRLKEFMHNCLLFGGCVILFSGVISASLFSSAAKKRAAAKQSR